MYEEKKGARARSTTGPRLKGELELAKESFFTKFIIHIAMAGERG